MFILKSKRRDVWGEKQQLDVSANIMMLSPEERVQKALQLFELMEKFVERHRQPPDAGPPPRLRPGRRPAAVAGSDRRRAKSGRINRLFGGDQRDRSHPS